MNGTSCVYPHSIRAPGVSPDPADHLIGCDVGVVTPDERAQTQRIAVQNFCRYGEIAYIFTSNEARGPTYAGFRGHTFTADGEQGETGGLAVWIERGIG